MEVQVNLMNEVLGHFSIEYQNIVAVAQTNPNFLKEE